MSKYLTITILIILLALLVLPQVAFAARFPFEGPLVPCGRRCLEWDSENPDKCITVPEGESLEYAHSCNMCHLFALAQNVIDGFITIILAIGTVMIGVGGFVILTSGGVPEKSSHGKKVITYTIVGLLVAFMSWMVINETMLLLVGTGTGGGEQKLPWPWDKVECTKLEYKIIKEEASETPEVPAGGKICRCELKDNEVKTQTYSSAEVCKSKCENWCTTFANYTRFCCVDKADQKCTGPSPKDLEKYCICEIPVYTIDPEYFPDKTSLIGIELKGTELKDANECKSKCISVNSGTYCPQRQLTDEAASGKFYCASQNTLEAKETKCIELVSERENITCYSYVDVCWNTVDPVKPGFVKEYAEKCWIDGYLYCKCTSGRASWCGDDEPYGLFAESKEKGLATYSKAYDCIRYCGVYAGEDCRLK